MKKLLITLSSISLGFGSTASVVSCSDSVNRFTNPTITDEIKNMIVAEIAGDSSEYQKYGIFKFGDVFNNSSKTKELAVRLINQIVSEYFFNASKKQWAEWTSKENAKSDIDTVQFFKHWILSLAENKLYTDYVDAKAKNQYLEYTMLNQGYFIKSQTDTWHVPYVPTTDKKAEYTGEPVFDFLNDSKLDDIKSEMSKRFQDYLYHSEVPDIIDKIIGTTYLNQNLLSSNIDADKNTSVFINKNGALLSKMQTWDYGKVASNFKMVWSIKIKNNADEIAKMNKKIHELTNTSGNDVTPSSIQKLFKDGGTGALVAKAEDDKDTAGLDPIFGAQHFQGFAAFDLDSKGAKTIVNSKSYVGNDVYTSILSEANNAGFLVHNSPDGKSNYSFIDSNKSYAYFVYALPIYAIDILKNMEVNFGEETNKKTKVDLKYYGSNGNSQSLDWQDLNPSNGQSVEFLHNWSTNLPEGTKEASLGTYANDNTTQMYDDSGVQTSGVNFTRLNILQWAEYSFAQEDSIDTAAKTRLYSIAFQYDKKNIYSKNLYDDISKYIESDD